MGTLTLKISDFSVSRLISANTQATSIVGTPCYTAPELYTEEVYGHKADIWSAGLIIYKGLYKKLPQFLVTCINYQFDYLFRKINIFLVILGFGKV
jgi:serine/threonine protein kinase